MWHVITGLIVEINTCKTAGAITSAVAMAFVCMDTMAYLSLPTGRETQGKADFIAWVDAYLKGDESQPYRYRGLDVYGARCAMLHAFGSESDFHEKNKDAKRFGYSDGNRHAYDPALNERLVIIGTASFLDDVVHAVLAFLEGCKTDVDLRGRVEGRLQNILETFPIRGE